MGNVAGNVYQALSYSQYVRTDKYLKEQAIEQGPQAVTVSFRDTGDSTSSTSFTHVMQDLEVDLTEGFDEILTRNSARLGLGGLNYVDRDGTLYHSIDPATNAGIVGGTLAAATGVAMLSDWAVGQPNAPQLQSLVTQGNAKPVNYVTFRIPITPVRSGSLQIAATTTSGEQLLITAPSSGIIKTASVSGTVDYEFGVVALSFGKERVFTEATAAGLMAQPWFDISLGYSRLGINYVIEPVWVMPDSITYNAVGYSYLPLSADVLQLDPVRLPSDGKVPIFRQSELVVLTCTKKVQVPNPSAGVTFDIGEVRLSTAQLIDSEDTYLSPDLYSINLDSGVVTFAEGFIIGDLVEPLFAEVRYQDMALATDVQINGVMALSRTITHTYSVADTIVSSALIVNDMQAMAFNFFAQQNWNTVWSNERDAPSISAQYNNALYPIQVSNIGAIEQRWALVFITSDTYRVIGETVGIVAQGTTTSDCQPINPATNKPYFKIRKEGWGIGWSAGHTFRMQTKAANYPVWLARTVLQGQETSEDDVFVVQTRGDIDRP